jgi:hypothetical protein
VLGLPDGEGGGDGDGEWLGRTGGGLTGEPDGDDGVSLGDGDVDDGSGEALPWLLPTWAGGGNASTGCPDNAEFIIACQVSAGSPAPKVWPPLVVTGLWRSVLPYHTAVDSCGVKPTNHASRFPVAGA